MIKKIIISMFFIVALFYITDNLNACNTLDWCLGGSTLVDWSGDLSIELWFKNQLLEWITKIAWFLWLMAVWAIVFWSFMMVISAWEEEKIKKAKDMIKWSILWFLWIVLSASLIAIVVNFMYSL